MRENTTLKIKGHNCSRYGSFVNQVFMTEKLVTHLNIFHNVYVRDQHFFCIKVNVGSVEAVRLEFCELEPLIYDLVFGSQECVTCGKVLLGLRPILVCVSRFLQLEKKSTESLWWEMWPSNKFSLFFCDSRNLIISIRE